MISIEKAFSGGRKGVVENKAVFLGTLILVVVLEIVFSFILENVMGRNFIGDHWLSDFVYRGFFGTFNSLINMGFWIISLKIVRGRKPEVGDVLASASSIIPIAFFTLILLVGNILIEKACIFIMGFVQLHELLQWAPFVVKTLANSNLLGVVALSQQPFVIMFPKVIFSVMVFFSMCFIVDRKMGLLASIRAPIEAAWGHKMHLFLFSLALVGLWVLIIIIIAVVTLFLGALVGDVCVLFGLVALYILWLWGLISVAHVYEGITSESPA